MSSIASRIRALRIARGMSAADLARATKLSQPSIHYIETGITKHLRGDTLVKIAGVLGVSTTYLMHGAKDATSSEVADAALLGAWRTLDAEQQRHILGIVQSLAGTSPPAPTPSAPAPQRPSAGSPEARKPGSPPPRPGSKARQEKQAEWDEWMKQHQGEIASRGEPKKRADKDH